MASVESSSTLERAPEIPKDSNDNREASVEINNIQNGGHVVSSVITTPIQQNPVTLLLPSAPATQVGKRNYLPFINATKIKNYFPFTSKGDFSSGFDIYRRASNACLVGDAK